MDRRSFIATTGAAAAVAAVGTAATTDETAASSPAPDAAPAVHTGVRRLTLAMPWRDAAGGLADRAERICRRMELALGERFRIVPKHHAHGGLEAVMTASADLSFGLASHDLGLHPALAYFAGLPGAGVLSGEELVAWLSVGGGQDHWDAIVAPHNVKPLMAGHLGRWPGLWSREPVRSLADLEGRRIAVESLARAVANGIGAVPVQLPADDLAAALAEGDVAAVELGGPLTSVAIGLSRAARHVTGFGINEGGLTLALNIRKSLWDGLAAQERATIEAVAAAECQLALAEARAHEKPMRSILRDGFGIQFAPMPHDASAAVDRVAEVVVAHAAGHDEIATRVDQSYHGFRNAVWGIDQVPVGRVPRHRGTEIAAS